MDIKHVLTYLSNRWAEGSTRRNLTLFIGSGAALLGFDVPPDQIGHWLQWINGLMMLVGLMGMVMPDALQKKQVEKALATVANDPIAPADSTATLLVQPISLAAYDELTDGVVTSTPDHQPENHPLPASDVLTGWNG